MPWIEEAMSETGEVMSSRLKAAAMLAIVPMELRTEILKKPKALRESYKDLRAYIEDVAFVNVADLHPPTIACLEEDDDDELMPVNHVLSLAACRLPTPPKKVPFQSSLKLNEKV